MIGEEETNNYCCIGINIYGDSSYATGDPERARPTTGGTVLFCQESLLSIFESAAAKNRCSISIIRSRVDTVALNSCAKSGIDILGVL